MDKYFRRFVILLVILNDALEASAFTTEAFPIVRGVVNRVLKDTSQIHDILCVDCFGNIFEGVTKQLQIEFPYVAFKQKSNVAQPVFLTSNSLEKKRKPSVVVQVCVKDMICRWGDLLLFDNPNKYAIFIQLFHGVARAQIMKLGTELMNGGVSKVLQFIAPLTDSDQPRIYISSALTRQTIEVANHSNTLNVLFDKKLTSFRGYMYEVGHVPMATHTYIKNDVLYNLEIEVFKTILRKQQAKFRFHQEKILQSLLPKLLNGNIDVLLNPVEMNGNYFEKVYWNEFRRFCLTLPRRYERMHLQLLLTPFRLNIWLVIVFILLALQISSLLCPRHIPHYLILRCLFGGGTAEHTLSTPSRMTVCAICVLIFLLSETYQAILLSLMTADPFVKNPETIEEFIALNQTIIVLTFMKNHLPTTLHHLVQTQDVIHLNTVLRNATVMSCDTAYYLNSNPSHIAAYMASKADIVVIQPPLCLRLNWIAFSWMSPAAREYQWYMNILHEVGLYQKEHQKWYPKRIYTKREQTFNDLIVLTEDLVPVWELLGTGLLISCLAFFIEWLTCGVKFLFNRYRHNRIKFWQRLYL